MNLESIHDSWKPYIYAALGNKEKFEEFFEDKVFYPSKDKVFKAFEKPFNEYHTVLLGQDPYPRFGDAIGLAFAIDRKEKLPSSLRIINKKLKIDKLIKEDAIVNMTNWQEQGVLLLNTALTVEPGKAGSHLKLWRPFTEKLIKVISKEKSFIWILLGKKSYDFYKYIYNPEIIKHLHRDIVIDPYKNQVIVGKHPASVVYGNKDFLKENTFKIYDLILNKKENKRIKYDTD